MAALAQWIHHNVPGCGLWFDSKHTIYTFRNVIETTFHFFKFSFNCDYIEQKNELKQNLAEVGQKIKLLKQL